MRWYSFTSILLLAVLSMGSGGTIRADSLNRTSAALTLIRSMPGRSWEAEQPVLVAVWEKRRAVVSTLIQQAGSGQGAARAAAMYLLGLLRLPDAVPILIRNLGFRFVPPPPGHAELGPASFYPAESALVSIGMPSVRAILKLLPHENSPLRRKLMVRVLDGVEGRAVTQFRLRRAIKNASGPQIRANLQAALKDIASQNAKK